MSGSDRVGAPDGPKKDDDNRVNMLQVAAATGASTTAAIVATLLGVYGTVIGVGVISLVSSITTVLYVRSMNSTKNKFRKVVTENPRAARISRASLGKPGPGASATTAVYSAAGDGDDATTAQVGRATADDETQTEASRTTSAAEGTTARGRASVPAATSHASEPNETGASASAGGGWREKLRQIPHNWRPILITTCVVFALSIVALSSIALLSGKDANAFYRATSPDTSEQTPSEENTGETYQEEESTGPSEDESPSPTPDEETPSPQPSQPTTPQDPEEPSDEEPTQPAPPAPEDPGDNNGNVEE